MEDEWKRQTLDSMDEWDEFGLQCGHAGTEERWAFEKAFLTQLEHDPLYQHHGPARESSIWENIVEDILKPKDFDG